MSLDIVLQSWPSKTSYGHSLFWFRSNYSEDFAQSSAINVAGPYFTTVAFAPLLIKSSNASVIVISSIAPFTQEKTVGAVTYPISKSGSE